LLSVSISVPNAFSRRDIALVAAYGPESASAQTHTYVRFPTVADIRITAGSA
jgi:hypothetical protein